MKNQHKFIQVKFQYELFMNHLPYCIRTVHIIDILKVELYRYYSVHGYNMQMVWAILFHSIQIMIHITNNCMIPETRKCNVFAF